MKQRRPQQRRPIARLAGGRAPTNQVDLDDIVDSITDDEVDAKRWHGIDPAPAPYVDAPMDEDRLLHHTTEGQEDPQDNSPDEEDPIDYGATINKPGSSVPKPKFAIIGTAQHASSPADGPVGTGTDPDIVTDIYIESSQPDQRIPVGQFMYMLKAPNVGAAVAAAGGFTVTIWMRNRERRQWGQTTSFSAAYATWVVTGDFNGGELFFQIGNVATPGSIELHVLEQN